jgi:low affinity Fe/Cu permease
MGSKKIVLFGFSLSLAESTAWAEPDQVLPIPAVFSSGESSVWIVVALAALLFFIVSLIWNLQLRKTNRYLESARLEIQEELTKQKEQFEADIRERTVGIVKLNEQLNRQITELQKERADQDKLTGELKDLLEVKSSGDFLPICSNCKDIRDGKGYWKPIEEFIRDLSDSDLSHTLCPECTQKLYPELFEGGAKPFCLSWNPNRGRHEG